MGGVRRLLLGSRFVATDRVPSFDLTPKRILLGYLMLGFTALYLSDVLVVRYLSDPLLTQVQAVKGAVEVLLTGAFIYLLTVRREDQLQDRREDIERQRQELQVLHRVFRHNLRNDLNIIQGYVGLLCDGDDGQIDDSACETIGQTLDRVERYTTNAERINRITTQGDTRSHFVLSDCIPAVCEPYEVPGEVEIQYDIPRNGPVVEANGRFIDCIEEFLINAVQYTDATPVQIRVSVSRTAGPLDTVELRIADNGPGIPEVEKRAFREGQEGDILHLSGMGLWYVAWTMQYSGGSLDLEENAAGGTTAVLRVPEVSDSTVRW